MWEKKHRPQTWDARMDPIEVNREQNSILNFECLMLIFEETNQQQMGIDLLKMTSYTAKIAQHMQMIVPCLTSNLTYTQSLHRTWWETRCLFFCRSYVRFLWPSNATISRLRLLLIRHHVHIRVLSPNWAATVGEVL